VTSVNEHLIHGQGAFRPPSHSELIAAQQALTTANSRIGELEAQNRAQYAALSAADAPGLTELLHLAIDVDDLDIEVEADEDSISVRIGGATINDNGDIVAPSQEFEVEFEVAIRGSFTVTASDEFEASERTDDVLRGFINELSFIEPDSEEGVSFIQVEHPDEDYRIREV
jgi:hypothetical protein